LVVLLMAACARAPGELGPLRQAAEPHLTTFARFETWSTRTCQSDVSSRANDALRDLTFAPLHSERAVLWAEVRSMDGRMLEFAAPIELAGFSFVNVEAPELGRLRMARSPDCRSAAQPTNKGTPCIVIARALADSAEDSLRMAFRDDAPLD
jgi:hypothetical protein